MVWPALPATLHKGRKMNIKRTLGAGVTAAFFLLAVVPAFAQDDGIAAAITSGDASINLRYRFEFVDQDSFSKDANASTLRLRMNYKTGTWNSWSAFGEFDYIFELLFDDFNSGQGTSSPNRNQYPVVADPEGADLNQLFFQYAPSDDWHARIGRQRILLDDQRFVGGVGWRQNEQTYDSVSFKYGGFDKGEVFYSYVGNVNRIFGDEVAAGDHSQDTHLLNATAELTDQWDIVGYAYIIDNEDSPGASTRTFGARINGGFAAGDGKVNVLGEFATQSDNANNPASYDADYLRIYADWQMSGITLGAGLESLGSDNGQAFRTPLATLHAFNGWADQFLSTPPAGLEDLYLKLGYKPGKWNLQLIYHDFSAETGSTDFGTEIDLSAGRKLGDRYGLLLKAALFDADDAAYVDTTKVWVMLTAGF